MGPGARQATPLFVSPGTVVHRARSRRGGRCSTFESAGIVLPTRGLSVHAFTSYCTWNFLRNSLWSAAPAIAWGVRRYKQLRGCTVHLRPLTPYLTTLTIRTVPYMMPAPLGPNHALDSFGIRAQAEQASRRELPGGMGGGEVCRAMSSTAWTPQEVSGPPDTLLPGAVGSAPSLLGWLPAAPCSSSRWS